MYLYIYVYYCIYCKISTLYAKIYMWFFIHNLDGFLWTSVTLLCPCLFVQVPSHGDHPCREFVVSLHELCESHRTSKWETQIKSNHKSRVEMSVAMCRNVSHMCRICVAYGYERRPFRYLPWTYPGPVRDLSTEDTKFWQGQSLKLSLMDHDVQRYIVSAAASSISGARCQWPYTIHGWT